MYKRELENLLRNNSLPKSIFLYGACSYQIDYFGEQIANIWSGGVEEITTFYFDDYDFSTVKNYLNQSSLFGDKNIVVLKIQKTIPKKELDVLVSICKKTDYSFLLVQNYDEQKAKNMTKSFAKKQSSDFVRFFRLHVNEAVGFIAQKAKLLHINIQPYAMQHLLLTHNENLSLAIGELPKLAILEHEVTKSDIDRLVYGLGGVGLDNFISNLVEKKDIKKEFQTLSEGGEYDEIFIINSLQSYISQLFLFHSFMKINGHFDARAVLGYPLPPDIAKRRASQCVRLSVSTYEEMLKSLAFAEITLKKGSFADKNTYLLSLLLKLQKIL